MNPLLQWRWPVQTNSDEPDLISRSRKGDLEAFNVLVERYQGSVYNLCFRMLSTREAAEDATQEAFVSAYRSLDKFRGGVFRSWLFRIAVNACYDELRRRRSRPALSLDEPRGEEARAFDPPSREASMEEHVVRLELAAGIENALKSLAPEHRLVIILCDVHGLDYAEIAQVTGVSLGTVKSRISRARSRLRVLLLERRELLPAPFRHTSEEA